MQAKYLFVLKPFMDNRNIIESNSVNRYKSELKKQIKKIGSASLVEFKIENLNLTRMTKHE
jgi:hypothetical protein